MVFHGLYTIWVGGQQPEQVTQTTSNILRAYLSIDGDDYPLSDCDMK